MTLVYGRTHARPNEWRALGRPPVLVGGRESLVPGTYRPTAATAGVPASATLTAVHPGGSTPNLTINESYIAAHGGRAPDGRFYLQDVDIHGAVTIAADDVTVRRARIRGYANAYGTTLSLVRAYSGYVGFVIEDSTIDPGTNARVGQDGVHGIGFAARRILVARTVDGFKIRGAGCTIAGSIVRDLTHYDDDPAQTDGSHNDAVQIEGGGPHVLTGNDLDAGPAGTAAVMVTQNNGAIVDPVMLDRNWLMGGGATVNIAEKGLGSIAAHITGNTFGGSRSGIDVILPDTSRTVSTIAGNVKTDGSPASIIRG